MYKRQQQNAALVEETTSASQSMKDQARELMRQVEAFKVNGASDTSVGRGQTGRADTPKAVSPPRYASPKPLAKKPLGGAKPAHKEPAGVGASNGQDRRSKEAEFEEF